VYGGPGKVWQQVSTAVWRTLKRTLVDEDPTEREEVFVTPPESPRELQGLAAGIDLCGDSECIRKVTRLLRMHDRIIDQVVWEPSVLPGPSDVRVSRHSRWRQTTVCFPK